MKSRNYFLILGLFVLFPQGCKWNDEIRPDDSPWGYEQPQQLGFDQSMLLELDSLFAQGRFGSVGSMLVLKDNELVFENYYGFTSRDSLQRIGSMGNALVSILLGAAVEDGYIGSIEDSIYTYLTDYASYFEEDPLKKRIRFVDLLTMKAGLSWNEGIEELTSPSNDLNIVRNSTDAVAYLLNKPIESIPGQRFSKNSASSLLIVKAIEAAVEMPVAEYLDQGVFKTLDITEWSAEKDQVGLSNIALGVSMRPIDLLKLGYLMLNNGEWRGSSVMGNEWVGQATSIQHRISNFMDIGYLWWRFSEESSWQVYFPENKAFYALSDDDQYMFVLPEQNMVYVLTTSNRNTRTTNIGYYVLSNYLLGPLQPID